MSLTRDKIAELREKLAASTSALKRAGDNQYARNLALAGPEKLFQLALRQCAEELLEMANKIVEVTPLLVAGTDTLRRQTERLRIAIEALEEIGSSDDDFAAGRAHAALRKLELP